MYRKIQTRAMEMEEALIKSRRAFHRIPETAWEERETSRRIAAGLRELGYLVSEGETVAGHRTGVIGELFLGEGPVMALRFDIDALPKGESTADSHRPKLLGFASEHPGCMHACGHDGHIAIGLGCARLLAELKEHLCGTIRLIFQPAEEGCRGAGPVVSKGWLSDVDYFLAGHIVPRFYVEREDLPVEATHNWDMVPVCGSLATTKINADFTGISCHGATPEKGLSVIPALASAALALGAIPRNSKGATFLNIGRMEAGEGRNILAGHGRMELEVRGETTELNHYMAEKAIGILKAQKALYGCEVSVEIAGDAPSLVSSPELAALCTELIRKQYPGKLNPADRSCIFQASEDCARMMEEVKSHGGSALYLLLPTDARASLHKEDYDFDEQILAKAVTIYVACLYELQRKWRRDNDH